ncbi:MAG: hypothetical protein ABIZ49_00135 [Opitutaceae bacterium]
MPLALVALVAAFRDGSPSRSKCVPPLGIEKIADNLFVIIGNGGNVGALVTEEGGVLDYGLTIVRSVVSMPSSSKRARLLCAG